MRSRRGADQSKVVRVGQDGEGRNRVGGRDDCRLERLSERHDGRLSGAGTMAKGEIGWADVTIVASNVYPNVTMDVFPERARNLKPPMPYAQPGYGEFSGTNRLSDALAFMVEKLNGALPDFFCKDEKVELSCSAEGTNAVLVLRAELRVPVAKKTVLKEAEIRFACPMLPQSAGTTPF